MFKERRKLLRRSHEGLGLLLRGVGGGRPGFQAGRWLGAALAVGLSASGPSWAAAPIDPYRYDFAGSFCSRGARPGATALLRWLTDHDAVGRSGGIYGCRTIMGTLDLSLHAEGRAVDWELDNRDARQRKIADGIVAGLLKRRSGHNHALARRMGIQEVIWNCRIWLAVRPDEGLVPYRPCSTTSSRTGRHENHVHFGLNRDGAERRTGYWVHGPWPRDLVAVRYAAARRPSSVTLDGRASYEAFLSAAETMLAGASNRTVAFLSGDYDNDWVDDLIAVHYRPRSRARLFIYSGATGFRSRVLSATTSLTVASARQFAFGLGDFNHDGRLDLYAIKYKGARSTAVTILNGADAYQSSLGSFRTALRRTSASASQFAVGDRDNDGFDDIYAIRQKGVRAVTVHVLDGASNFASLQASPRTALPTRNTSRVRFLVADLDDDGHEDIYGIHRRSRRRPTLAYALAGPTFRSFNLYTNTALRASPRRSWAFALPANPSL